MSLVDNGSRAWRPSTATSIGQPIAVEAHRHAPWHGQLGAVDERLHLDRETAAALDGDVHGRSRGRPRVAEKQGRRIGDALKAGGRHLEDPQSLVEPKRFLAARSVR